MATANDTITKNISVKLAVGDEIIVNNDKIKKFHPVLKAIGKKLEQAYKWIKVEKGIFDNVLPVRILRENEVEFDNLLNEELEDLITLSLSKIQAKPSKHLEEDDYQSLDDDALSLIKTARIDSVSLEDDGPGSTASIISLDRSTVDSITKDFKEIIISSGSTGKTAGIIASGNSKVTSNKTGGSTVIISGPQSQETINKVLESLHKKSQDCCTGNDVAPAQTNGGCEKILDRHIK